MGISERLIVIEYGDDEDEEKPKKLYAVINPEIIEEYVAAGGYEALAKALTQMSAEEVIAEMKKSGLRGRGGGGGAGARAEAGRPAREIEVAGVALALAG